MLQATPSSATPERGSIDNWKKNNLLVLSVPVKLDTPKPTSFLNAHTKFSLPLIFEPLVSIGTQQELNPVLAKSWVIGSDNKSIIITIKKHHFFSDNTEVTAKEIAESIKRVCSKESRVSSDLKGLNGCDEMAKGKNSKLGISIIDKYKVKFTINCSPTNFLYQLASPGTVITKLTESGLVGSGPYKLKESDKEHILLIKNPYASKDNQALNSGVVIFYSTWKDLPSLFEKSKPDGAIMYRMQDIWKLKKNDDYITLKINPNITETLVLNNQRFPFNNPLLRQALASEIYNRFNEKCISGAHKAYGLIPYGTGGSIANNLPKSLPEITSQEVFKQVPLLSSERVNVTLHQLADSKIECESQQIIEAAKKYNINLKFKYHNDYQSLKSLYLSHNLDGFIELYVFRNREAYSTLQFFTNTGDNHANVNDRTIDNNLRDAISESSSHLRYQAYQKIVEYMQSQGVVIPLFYTDHALILSKCITGVSNNFLFNPFLYIPKLHKIDNCNIQQ